MNKYCTVYSQPIKVALQERGLYPISFGHFFLWRNSMLTRSSPNKSLGWLLLLTTLLATPVAAHNVETAQDVGATFHIEPNDAPRAGKSELAWFALTQKGGKLIPLEDCNCQLAVYSQPSIKGSPPLQQPPLKPVSAKRYKGIPGAEITFPKPGAYQLQLTGTPTNSANFTPFELKFDVTVAPGAPAPKTSLQTAQSPQEIKQPENRWLIPAIAIATILGLGIFGVVWRKLNS